MSADPHVVTREQVLEALRSVEDPELHKSIVDLEMVRDIQVSDGRVSVNALLTISACPLRETIVNSIRERVRTIPGVREVDVTLGEMAPNERQELIAQLSGGEVSATRPLAFITPAARGRVVTIAVGSG